MVARKTIVVAPTLPASAKLMRFQSDATDAPLYTVATWTTRHGKGAAVRKRQLMIENASHRLLEMQRIGASKDKNRSWFIGNHVQQDGSMVVLTPMDPLFVLLHAVAEQKERYLSTYDLLSRDQNVWWLQLGPTLTQAKIELICDVQYTGDDAIDNLYVRVNEEKVLTWLTAKVDRVATLLATQVSKNESNGAFDNMFLLPGQEAKQAATEPTAGPLTPAQVQRYHREAVDVIADYLPHHLVGLLMQKLNIRETAPVAAAPVAEPIESIRRFDRRNDASSEDTTPSKRASANSTAAGSAKKKSKLANVDRTGMKSLASFFGKK